MGDPMDSLPRDLRLQRQAERQSARAVGTPEQIIASLQAELARVRGELDRAMKAASELDKAALEERAAREKAEAERDRRYAEYVGAVNQLAAERERAEQAESRLAELRGEEAVERGTANVLRETGGGLTEEEARWYARVVLGLEAALLERGGE